VLAAIKAQITELIKNPTVIKDELARTKTQLEAEFSNVEYLTWHERC
jgi:zinc protease